MRSFFLFIPLFFLLLGSEKVLLVTFPQLSEFRLIPEAPPIDFHKIPASSAGPLMVGPQLTLKHGLRNLQIAERLFPPSKHIHAAPQIIERGSSIHTFDPKQALPNGPGPEKRA
jgi:hypothetical protein